MHRRQSLFTHVLVGHTWIYLLSLLPLFYCKHFEPKSNNWIPVTIQKTLDTGSETSTMQPKTIFNNFTLPDKFSLHVLALIVKIPQKLKVILADLYL